MIVGYIVEKRKKGAPDWDKVNHIPAPGESMTVPDLDEGEEYEFRVTAVNSAGNSDPSLCTAPVKIEDKTGMTGFLIT
jgi:hypothetical protein